MNMLTKLLITISLLLTGALAQFGQNIVMFIIDNIVVTLQKSTTVVLQSIAKKNK